MAQPESSDVKGNVFIQALRSFCSDHHADDALFHAETQEPRNTLYFGAIFDWMVTFIIHTYISPHLEGNYYYYSNCGFTAVTYRRKITEGSLFILLLLYSMLHLLKETLEHQHPENGDLEHQHLEHGDLEHLEHGHPHGPGANLLLLRRNQSSSSHLVTCTRK